jgi:hypothetical protein
MTDVPCSKNRAKQTQINTTAAIVLVAALELSVGSPLEWKDSSFPSGSKYVAITTNAHTHSLRARNP